MSNRTQSVSTQLIASVAFVVAVNSAIWWRKISKEKPKLGNEDESDKEQEAKSLQDKKDKKRTAHDARNHRSTSTIKGRKQVRGGSALAKNKGAIKSPKKNVASTTRENTGSRSNRPTPTLHIDQTSPLRKTKTRKGKPRVRQSLLPWNNNSQQDDITVVDAPRELPLTPPKPSLRRTQKTAKVRDSLLPWNSRDDSLSPLPTAKKSPIRIRRVRDSLLPESIRQNNNNSNNNSKASDFGDEGSICAPSMNSKPMMIPRVRDSLLPENIRPTNNTKKASDFGDEGSVNSRPTITKAPKILRVRDSLLPENIRQANNNSNASEFGDEGSICAPSIAPSSITVRSRSNIHEEGKKQTQASKKPSDDGLQENLTDVLSCEEVEGYVSIRATKTRRDDRESPLLVHHNESNVTSRRSAASSMTEAPEKKRVAMQVCVPLRNVSNTKRRPRAVPHKRRKSSELKEEGWKQSTLSKKKMLRETVKSPTLMRLSSRHIDDGDDVRSLCKAFEP